MRTIECPDNEHEWIQEERGGVIYCEVCGKVSDYEGDHDAEVKPNGQI